ncbi:MAG: hypothetical protein FWE31_00875 [Firmicutes bacterium]|nr:hypothetical protein [Bacillota bacterium]
MFGLLKRNKKEMGIWTTARQREKQSKKFVSIDKAKYHYDPGKESSAEEENAFVEARAQAMSRHFRAVFDLLARHNLLSDEGKEMKQELDTDIYCDGTLNSDMIKNIDANVLDKIYDQAANAMGYDYTENGTEKFMNVFAEGLRSMTIIQT